VTGSHPYARVSPLPNVRDNICPVPDIVTPVTNGVTLPAEASVNVCAEPDSRNPVDTVSAGKDPIAGNPVVVG